MAITVTATPTGAAGTLLRVLVLTGATASGGASATSSSTGGSLSITPNFSNSFIVWSVDNRFSNAAFTSLTNNTTLDNVSITGGSRLASGEYTGTVTSGSAVTAGATSAGGAGSCVQSNYEVPASGGSTPAVDASSPAAVSAASGSAALTTASFTPPAGSVVVAIVNGANFPSAWTVTDSSSMTWTKRVDNGDGQQIWTATVPSSGTNVNLTTPNLALAAPLVTPGGGANVNLVTPNLALAAPLVTPGSGANVNLTTPNLALAAPVVTPGGGANVNLVTPNLALAAPVVTPAAAGPVTVNLTTPNLSLAAPALAPPSGKKFPAIDLDMRVELLLGGVWTNISTHVFQDSTLIQRGHPDESTQATPSTFSALLDNSDGRFSSLNPTGPYYGNLGLNTEIRVSIPEGASYFRLQDQASYYSAALTAPSAAFTIFMDVTPDNWFTNQGLAAQWDNNTGNNRCWDLETGSDGTIWLYVSHDGTSGNQSSFGLPRANYAPFVAPNRRLAFSVVYDPSTDTATWFVGSTQVGSSTNSTSTTVFASTAVTTIGAEPLNVVGTHVGMTGKVHQFLISHSGTTFAFADFTAQAAGTTSFADPQGHTWTLTNNGVGEISDRKYRFHGEVAAWPQAWGPIGPNAVMPISAAGTLRRIGRTNVPIDSAMKRACVRLSGSLAPAAYWSCEDGAGATSFASGIGGLPMTISPVGGSPNLAADTSFVCSQALPVMNGASFTGTVPKHARGTANVVRFLMKVPSGGDTDQSVIARFQTSGTVQLVTLVYGNTGTLQLLGYDRDGNQLFNTTAVAFNVNGGLYRVSMEMTNSGSSILAAVVVVKVGANTGLSATQTLASTQVDGRVTRVDINPRASALLTGTVFGHITVQETWESLFDQSGPVAAWNGEAAGDRFMRLCGEEGIAFRGLGNMDDTVPMGTQGLETLPTLLQECVDADRGMWLEPRQVLGFGYRTRVTLGNQYAAIPLDYNQDQLDDGILPTLDDQLITNDVTATSPTGASSRQTLDDGSAMAVGTVGRYDTSLQVNVQDSELDDAALWVVHEGTVNEPRYPVLGIDLSNAALSTALFQSTLDADIGDRLTVANPPVNLPPGQIDQVINGLTETLSRRALDEAYNGRPASPWNVPYLDGDPVSGVWNLDTDGSTLAAGITSTATSFTVTTTSANSPLWTTSAGDFPFDISVGGERMTVTNITGTSSPQTFTVTRSVNGVVKAHLAGEDLRLYAPPIISL